MHYDLFQRLEETVTDIAEFKNYFLDENGIIHETDMRKKEWKYSGKRIKRKIKPRN